MNDNEIYIVYGNSKPDHRFKKRVAFIPKCNKCGSFVKADKTIKININDLKDQSNATCNKCGRVKMIIDGVY